MTTASRTSSKYEKCIKSLLFRVQSKGIKLEFVDDGEERIDLSGFSDVDSRREATDAVCSVDGSRVYVSHEESRGFLFIVLGNDRCECLADYGVSKGDNARQLMQLLDQVSEEFYEQWS